MLGYKVQVYVVTTFPSSVNMTIKAFIGSFPTGYRATVPGTRYLVCIHEANTRGTCTVLGVLRSPEYMCRCHLGHKYYYIHADTTV